MSTIDTSQATIDEIRAIGKRIRRAIATARRGQRDGEMDVARAKGYVIGRIDNLLRFVREHPAITDVPWDARRDYFYGLQYIGIVAQVEPIVAARENKDDLRTLETKADLPRGAAGHGSCCRCGRDLSNHKSVADGIGPECARKG